MTGYSWKLSVRINHILPYRAIVDQNASISARLSWPCTLSQDEVRQPRLHAASLPNRETSMADTFALPRRGLSWIETRVEQRPILWRWLLAGPLALILGILSMAGLPMVLPAGAGGINHLVLPVVLFPLLWSVFIVLPVSTARVGRMAMIYGGLTVLLLFIIAMAFLT